jgi:hypothetical protein
MSELMVQLAARLTIHEYLLEVMYANLAANAEDPQSFVQDFGNHLIDRAKTRMAPPLAALGLDREFEADVRREMESMMTAFAERMRVRVSEMVEQKD